MKIVLAFDKFKGSATGVELAEAARGAILDIIPDTEVITAPVADGGDGTVDAVLAAMGSRAEVVEQEVMPPLFTMPRHTAKYALLPDDNAAFVELAAASGVALVPQEIRDPMQANTFGTGELILDAIDRGCRTVYLAIGGSATNDAATGLLAALGFEFYDNRDHHVFPCGGNLAQIASIDDSGVSDAVRATRFVVMCDVDNPLYGSLGAAHVYAPQKGASPEQVMLLDEGLRHFAKLMPPDVPTTAGAGAAGGVGAGMMAFLNAKLQPGVETVLDMIHFPTLISGADLVITGEGRFDRQTLMGKAPSGVLAAAKRQGIPVVAINGSVDSDIDIASTDFAQVLAVTPPDMPLSKAMSTPVALANLKNTIHHLLNDLAW